MRTNSRNQKLSFMGVAQRATAVLLSLMLPMSAHAQGPLSPPGPPAPAMKTLDQVEPRMPISSLPFTIQEPGSYFLTTNLSTSGFFTDGIIVAADDVTIDLGGFVLSGAIETGAGIVVSGNRRNLAIRNGTLRGWENGGAIAAANARNCLVESLRVYDNFLGGISVGRNSVVRGCIAENNPLGPGISTGQSSVVQDCAAIGNATGISVGDASTVSTCSASGNGGAGISTGAGSTVVDCAARSNGTGIQTGTGSSVIHCSASRNATGIQAGFGGAVSGCTVQSNTEDGILVSSQTRVADNTCDNNGTLSGDDASGIRATGASNRIEGNTVTQNDRGIELTSSFPSLVIRNSARSNGTNYVFNGSQAYGPTNAVAGEITSENPWRNFSY